ncbi:hypothetical protein ACIQVT_05225 [Streptomyces sp. NPDC100445]|uniref:hypothetical protein n=1 Tax=Streptomyces sp. NPDC100445 TaxID=3366102 RepID=UPI0038138067
MDIDLVTVVLWGAAARIFIPDLRRAGRHLLAVAVRTGAHHLRQQTASAATATSSALDAATREGEA